MGRPASGYRNAAGDKVPGTTTIIGRFKDSKALMYWAFEQGQDPDIEYLYQKRDTGGATGTIAHDMIEAAILQKPFERPECTDESYAQAYNAYMQYEEWKVNNKIEILKTEEYYVSEKHQFGGTIDAIGKDAKGDIVLVDWKTSSGVYPDFLIQLAAYNLLLKECAPELAQTGGYHLLRISKENADFAHYHFGELENAERSFILMRQLFDLDKKLKIRLK